MSAAEQIRPLAPLELSASHEAERALAAAVIQQAYEDLTAKKPRDPGPPPRGDEKAMDKWQDKVGRLKHWEEDRMSARLFLLKDLWEPSCIWGQLAQLNKDMVIAAVKKAIGEQ